MSFDIQSSFGRRPNKPKVFAPSQAGASKPKTGSYSVPVPYAGSRAAQKICRLTNHVHSKIRTTDILNVVIGVSRRANTAMKAVAVGT